MKRIRSSPVELADDALEDGALLLLAIRAGHQQQQEELWQEPEVQQAACKSAAIAEAEAPKSRQVAKSSRSSYGTRSYVWRGLHRGALALQKQQKQQQQQTGSGSQPLQQGSSPAAQQQQQHYCSSASEGNSSRRRSASGAAPSDDDEVAQQQQQQQQLSPRQRDKEWAALTTWLRMNLHHPRTAKKLVQFVGQQDEATGVWSFCLNPGLAWHDISLETRLRLKTLPVEAEQAFSHKYPRRPPHEWADKLQKYRPPGSSSSSVTISLRDMVTSLSRIYYQHEPSESIAAGLGLNSPPMHSMAPQQQQQLDAVHPAAVHPAAAPVDFYTAAAAAAAGLGFGAAPVHDTALQQQQQLAAADLHERAAAAMAARAAGCTSETGQYTQMQVQQQLLGVHPGAQLPRLAAAAAAAATAAAATTPEVDSAACVSVVDAALNTDNVRCMNPQPMLSSTGAYSQQQQQRDTSNSRAQLLPCETAAVVAAPAAAAAAGAAGPGDGIDSCAAAVTPVSAPWTHCMAF